MTEPTPTAPEPKASADTAGESTTFVEDQEEGILFCDFVSKRTIFVYLHSS